MSKLNVNGIINVPCSIEDGSFFKRWLDFLTPFHSLTNREKEVAACFIKHRYLLSRAITDNDVLDRVVMSEETKKKIRQECDITTSYFQVIMGKFKQVGFIVDNKLNPKLIPKGIKDGDNSFRLLLHFNFDAGNNKETS